MFNNYYLYNNINKVMFMKYLYMFWINKLEKLNIYKSLTPNKNIMNILKHIIIFKLI